MPGASASIFGLRRGRVLPAGVELFRQAAAGSVTLTTPDGPRWVDGDPWLLSLVDDRRARYLTSGPEAA